MSRTDSQGAATRGLNDEMDRDNGSGGDLLQSPLAVLSRAEIDQQISTAKRYPRSIARAKQKMIEMAIADEETARGCFYTLKRRDADGRDVFIEGPSVRLAEIAVHAWGNIRSGARIIGEEDGFIVAQGVCHDMEANTWTSIEVRRRITGRNGRRYSDDMIGVTANAACAIAYRNAVHKIVPKVYINPAYEAARNLVAGDIKSIGQRRQNAVEAFKKMFVTLEQLMIFLDKPGKGVDDIDGDDLVRLAGVMNAIKDGDASVDEMFPAQPKPGAKQTQEGGAAGLNAAIDADKDLHPDKAAPPKPADGPKPVTLPSESEAERILREKSPSAKVQNPLTAKDLTPEQRENIAKPDEPQPLYDSRRDPRDVRHGIVPQQEVDAERGKQQQAHPASAPAPVARSVMPDGPPPVAAKESGRSDKGKFPPTLPDSARKSKTFIDDAIRELRGDISNHLAKKRFHGADVASWETLPPARQDEKYVGLLNGDWKAIERRA